MSKPDTTAMQRFAMILSARDQIAMDRRCDRALGSMCRDRPCACLDAAERRVDSDLEGAESV